MFKSILAATDGSQHGSLAAALAADLAEKYDARLLLLSVVDNRELPPSEQHLAEIEYSELQPGRTPGSRTEDLPGVGLRNVWPVMVEHAGVTTGIREALAHGVVKHARLMAKDKGVANVDTRVKFGDAAPAILEAAKDFGADLIVLGNRGLSDLRGLMLGSVSHKVANLAEVSVITVK